MKKEDLAIGGVLGASLLIGAFCLGPALFLLFGVSIGALGMLAVLEPYRPIFIAVGGGALFCAAVRAWRPVSPAAAAAECVDEACSPDSPQRSRTRTVVTFALVIYILAIAYPFIIARLV